MSPASPRQVPPAVLTVLAVALALVTGGCSAPAQPVVPRASAEGAVRLTATLDSPTDVTLRWRGGGPATAGYAVEFATDLGGPYTILGFLPPSRTTYTHPDLIPRTTFTYRVRPLYGPASEAVDVTVPGRPAGDRDQRNIAWTAPTTRPGGPPATRPVTGPGGAPSNLSATVRDGDGIAFTWTDRSTDEEGFLLEDRPRGQRDFRVVAYLDPGVNAFGLITLPDERRAAYRVRAFRYGPSSNLVHRTTGGDP
ncbi:MULTISPECIES: fibronectin type III domain-containing protein [unclassified Nonomuraea]|uniref:fibronectin type III domain-containing protein n=1 Tax=unclassified Nonomuraea TaxID=2593643 RepID=UPI0033F29ACD